MPRRLPKIAIACLMLYWALLFVATHVPNLQIGDSRYHFDKAAHLVAYAALAWMGAAVLHLRGHSFALSCAVMLGVVAVYGAVDEILQPWFSRTADIADWVADVCGAVLGLAVYSVTFRPLRAALHRWRAWRAG
ncbi:MAG: VanZ family protein [Planctomycetales bacterium]|nr:VanZ family protein [Planctomycetales bacterium]